MTNVKVIWASPSVRAKTHDIVVMIHVGNPDGAPQLDGAPEVVPTADELLSPAHKAALMEWLGYKLTTSRTSTTKGVEVVDQTHQCPRSMTDIMRESAGETNR